MAMNGIGPLVSQWVHERNAARHAAPAKSDAAVVEPTVTTPDTVEFSPAALARFETWKAKHGGSGVIETVPDQPAPVDPTTIEPAPTDPATIDPPTTTVA
jgi:hypothetical protein